VACGVTISSKGKAKALYALILGQKIPLLSTNIVLHGNNFLYGEAQRTPPMDTCTSVFSPICKRIVKNKTH